MDGFVVVESQFVWHCYKSLHTPSFNAVASGLQFLLLLLLLFLQLSIHFSIYSFIYPITIRCPSTRTETASQRPRCCLRSSPGRSQIPRPSACRIPSDQCPPDTCLSRVSSDSCPSTFSNSTRGRQSGPSRGASPWRSPTWSGVLRRA